MLKHISVENETKNICPAVANRRLRNIREVLNTQERLNVDRAFFVVLRKEQTQIVLKLLRGAFISSQISLCCYFTCEGGVAGHRKVSAL